MRLPLKKLFTILVTAAALIVIILPNGKAVAAPATGIEKQPATAADTTYDPADPIDLRLWSGLAPGAAGSDPRRDIPFIRVSRADGDTRHAAFLIIPGGGYDKLTDAKEQAPVAEYFARVLHVTAFVLYYRLAQKDGTYRYPIPMWDGQRALHFIRFHAPEYGVDPNRIGVFGFSAGGHLAATLALHSATDFGLPSRDEIDSVSAKVDLLGLGYPVISMDPADVPSSGSVRNLLRGYRGAERKQLETYLSGEKNVTPNTPPVFLFESLDDKVISPLNSILFVQALKQTAIPTEAHLYAHGEHGSGLSVGIPDEEAWAASFRQWLSQSWSSTSG